MVSPRPEGNANPNLPTGEIEIIADEVEVLNEAAPLPFPVEEHHATPVNEEVRLKYRYLDLRRQGPRFGAPAAQPGEPAPPATCSPSTTSSRSRRRR